MTAPSRETMNLSPGKMWFEIPKKFRKAPEAVELLRIDAEFTKACAEELRAVKTRLWETSPFAFDALCERSRQLQESLKAAVAVYDQATSEPEPGALPPDLVESIARRFEGGERDKVAMLLAKTIAILRRQRFDMPGIAFDILTLADGDCQRVEHIATEACIDFRDVVLAAKRMSCHPTREQTGCVESNPCE